MSVSVDGTARLPEWRGNFLELNGLAGGQEVEVLHSMRGEVCAEVVAGRKYTVSWQGNTVMNITPPGKNVPLYQRRETDRDATAVEATMI